MVVEIMTQKVVTNLSSIFLRIQPQKFYFWKFIVFPGYFLLRLKCLPILVEFISWPTAIIKRREVLKFEFNFSKHLQKFFSSLSAEILVDKFFRRKLFHNLFSFLTDFSVSLCHVNSTATLIGSPFMNILMKTTFTLMRCSRKYFTLKKNLKSFPSSIFGFFYIHIIFPRF